MNFEFQAIYNLSYEIRNDLRISEMVRLLEDIVTDTSAMLYVQFSDFFPLGREIPSDNLLSDRPHALEDCPEFLTSDDDDTSDSSDFTSEKDDEDSCEMMSNKRFNDFTMLLAKITCTLIENDRDL